MYRVNGAGQFNVAFGRYTNATICDAENLRACARALQGVDITCHDFEDAVGPATFGDGDVISRLSTGKYRARIPCTEAGKWFFAWDSSEGTTASGVQPGSFYVDPTVP